TQPQDPQAWAQAAVQCCDPCLTGARRADVCVGGQIRAVAPPVRVHPAAPLRDEIDGLHLDQSEAFLSCLKLATSYIFLGRTFSGHNHDYLMLKQEFPPELDWFADINVRVDLGYLGMKADYRGDRIDIPTKKPRKSKKNPTPQLSDEQKAANTALSRVRIFIEHAIGGMKRYTILVHGFRNRKVDFEDDAIGVCAGL